MPSCLLKSPYAWRTLWIENASTERWSSDAPDARGSKTSQSSTGKWCARTTGRTTSSSIDGWRETWGKLLSPDYSFLFTWLYSVFGLISFHVPLLAFSCPVSFAIYIYIYIYIFWVCDCFLLSCAWFGYVILYWCLFQGASRVCLWVLSTMSLRGSLLLFSS